jgi:hypothetical protein
MAKEADQTQETIDTTEVKDEVQAEQKDTKSDENLAKAVKTSEKFDEKLAEEGVDDDSLPAPKDSKSKKDNQSQTEEETETDVKDSGKVDDEVKGDEVKDEQTQTEGDELKVSEKLAKEAVDLGLTPEEVAEFENDDELTKTLNIIKSVLADTEDAPAGSQQQAPPDKKVKEDSVPDALKFENEDEIDPGLLKGIKAMQKHYEEQIKTLSEKVDAMQSNVTQERQTQFVKRFDDMVDKLGIEFAEVFGKGSTKDFSKRSMAFKNRDAVRAHMYAYARGLSEAGLPIPDEQALFNVALHSLHGEKVKTIEGLRSSRKADAYAKGSRTGRPATRKAAGLNPMQRAIETSKKFDDLVDTSEN